MTAELQTLLVDVVESGWAHDASERLAIAIEERIVASVPSRLRSALGTEEAAQMARWVAWERCKQLTVRLPSRGVSWGYLANTVRWRLKDAVRADALRAQRHPLTPRIPELQEPDSLSELGSFLDQIAMELRRNGLPFATARRYLVIAGEGPRFERAAITARLISSGASRAQGEAFGWLLRGGAVNPSALERLASGQRPSRVFADPVVQRWVRAAAGRDPWFSVGRTGGPARTGTAFDLARSA